jgi:type IV pilus assembly protein PilM
MQIEDIFNEVNKLVDFYRYTLTNEKQDVTKFLVIGDHPMLEAIIDEMKDRYDIPVEILTLDKDSNGKAVFLPSNLFLPLGLALKEVQ